MSNETDAPPPPRKKPVMLGIALVAMALIGLHTLSEGYLAIEIVTDPFAGAALFPATQDSARDAANGAFVAAIVDQARVALPVGIAQLLLGGLLLAVSLKALFGRISSTSLALQLIAANVLLLIVGYLLREPVRSAIVEAIVAGGVQSRPDGVSAEQFAGTLRVQGWWLFRLKLAVQVGVLVLSGFALTRPSIRDALSPPEPSKEG